MLEGRNNERPNIPWIVCFLNSVSGSGKTAIKQLVRKTEMNILFVLLCTRKKTRLVAEDGASGSGEEKGEEMRILSEIEEESKEGGIIENPTKEIIGDFFSKMANVEYRPMTLVF